MSAVLEIEGLRKTYRSRRRGPRHALDGFDMRVEAGQVHGFLGPNGSGKTTTLRTLLGLIRPNGGRMAILGHEVPQALPVVAGQVGAIVESPQFFPHFSARDTLGLLAGAGQLPRQRVDEVLELVGLRDRAGERVKTYSLGMKQRLAVASALLKNPKLLILDEPANGLDPGGIRWMRDLLRDYANRGGTVLLSSHLLHEIEVIADHLVVIGRGVIVADGSKAELLNAAGTLVRGLEPDALARCLDIAGYTYRTTPDGAYVVEATREQIATATAHHGVVVTELRGADGAGLEDMFLQLTADDAREKVSA